jgi:putative Mg2+ transporter-C (MgtC) family protein
MTRIGAQVINGIGFLGAGTILVTEKQQVKGLTTAAGLWASACMGLALGAGFYECVLLSFLLIGMAVLLLPKIENLLVSKSRNMDIYVEVSRVDGIHQVIAWLKKQNLHIYNVDISGASDVGKLPNAIFSIRLEKGVTHTRVVEQLSHLECIRSIEEF